MKRFGLLFLLVVFCGRESQAQAQKAEAPPLTVIRAGTLIDGQSETPRKNQLIFVRGQRITHTFFCGARILQRVATTRTY